MPRQVVKEKPKRTRVSSVDKRFDFADIIDTPCFYNSLNACDLPGELVLIRMLTSKPYWLCMEHAYKYIRAARKSELRLSSNRDDVSPGVKASE